MTVLVTGAAGFLGGRLTELLASTGERPRALVRSLDRLADDDVDIYAGDIADRALLEAAMDGVDRVLHMKAKMAMPGPVRVAFGAPMRLRGEDYAALAVKVERRVKSL